MVDSHRFFQINMVGRKYEFEIMLEESLLDSFADLSGDSNPIHLSDEYAKKMGHPGRVAHGVLLAGFVSRLVGMHLPGGDVLILSLKMDFHSPSHPGDFLKISGEIISEQPSTRTLELAFKIENPRGLACKGKALLRQNRK